MRRDANENKLQDMDVTLTWDTVFGILDAARKYMVEDYRARLQTFHRPLAVSEDLELQCRRWVALEAREAAGAVGPRLGVWEQSNRCTKLCHLRLVLVRFVCGDHIAPGLVRPFLCCSSWAAGIPVVWTLMSFMGVIRSLWFLGACRWFQWSQALRSRVGHLHISSLCSRSFVGSSRGTVLQVESFGAAALAACPEVRIVCPDLWSGVLLMARPHGSCPLTLS